MRHARLRLWRLSPPFTRTVEVHRITVGGFLDLVRLIAPKVAEAMVKKAQYVDGLKRQAGIPAYAKVLPSSDLTDNEFIAAGADAESVAAAADLLCLDQPVGFMRGWVHGRFGGAFARMNTAALLRACRAVEGDGQWTRFLGCINRQPVEPEAAGKRKKKRGGGLMADVLDVSRLFGQVPADILRLDLQDFLTLCEAINLSVVAESRLDPTADPDVEPDTTIPIAGLWQVH